MILVKVYCKAHGCGKLLATIKDPLPGKLAFIPRRYVGYGVARCRRHGGGIGGFRRLAKPGMTVSITFGQPRIPPDVLWTLIDTARRTGRTQTYGI